MIRRPSEALTSHAIAHSLPPGTPTEVDQYPLAHEEVHEEEVRNRHRFDASEAYAGQKPGAAVGGDLYDR